MRLPVEGLGALLAGVDTGWPRATVSIIQWPPRCPVRRLGGSEGLRQFLGRWRSLALVSSRAAILPRFLVRRHVATRIAS